MWKGWDTRDGCTKPIFFNKFHTMGITAIQSSPYNENILAVGSYDENVCLYDIRSPKQPVYTHHVGGGVWRVKWHPFSSSLILVAAMHHGFHVLKCENASSLESAFHYEAHQSLAYGADWYCPTNKPSKHLIGTSSFYDHLFTLWSFSE
eukprot:TRINITY_DN4601_c0_g1_i2.p1 TRINITY_DN4601_c0_g1~~TRINITY_DN4601_c0_g1_i2.p1  ORF type:complete len:149 (-),score=22.25 TRINITY_DN4601_c0_g1_i2:4-450(-)